MPESQTLDRPVATARTKKVATHKLFPPAPFAGAIHRAQALDRVVGEQASRVVFLQAPAGYGKSTLLQQAKSCCEAQKEVTAWLTLDEADNDVTRLAAHLEALVGVAAGDTPGAAVRGKRFDNADGHALPSDWFIEALLDLERPVAIFFDEFQALTDLDVLGVFRRLLEQAPDNIRLLIGSRTTPDFNLSRLTVNNRAAILRPEDLCFSQDEVQKFFAAAEELNLSDSEAVTVHARTEGWPAALQFYRLALADSNVRVSLTTQSSLQPRELTDYLANNVLRLQSPAVQSFLLQSAPLARLSAELCDDVLGRNDSRAMLDKLEAGGLFLRSVGSDGSWFRYHSLFASFLADQLQQQQPDRLAAVHAQAARWFQDHKLSEEALHHACAGGDHATAAQILETWARYLLPKGHLRTVERWYERIAAEEIERRPDLVVDIAYALIFLHRHDQLSPLLAMLERLSEADRDAMETDPAVVQSMAAIIAYDDLPGAEDAVAPVTIDAPDARGFHAFELAAAANFKGYLALAEGRFEAAREALALARAHSDRSGAKFSGGYSIATAGMNLLAQARTEETLDLLAAGVARAGRWLGSSHSSAVVVSCYIGALYEVDRLDEALEHFQKFHDIIVDAAALDYFAAAVIPVARIYNARGHTARATAVLEEAEQVARRCQWQRLIRMVAWERVRQSIVAGDVAAAGRIAEQIPERSEPSPAAWLPFSEDANDDRINEIRLAIHAGHRGAALELIADEMRRPMPDGRVRRRVKLEILEALAHQLSGDNTRAAGPLRSALKRAAPARLVRTFLEEGEAMVDLLQQELATFDTGKTPTAEAGARRDFIAVILAGADAPMQPMPETNARTQPLESLTEREMGILRRLAMGDSNKEIARNVFVSENTVKFHLKNIYSKLGVTSRVQAIGAGRDLGLI